jgi:hypothetical protein
LAYLTHASIRTGPSSATSRCEIAVPTGSACGQRGRRRRERRRQQQRDGCPGSDTRYISRNFTLSRAHSQYLTQQLAGPTQKTSGNTRRLTGLMVRTLAED